MGGHAHEGNHSYLRQARPTVKAKTEFLSGPVRKHPYCGFNYASTVDSP